jgi:hypothetical protein
MNIFSVADVDAHTLIYLERVTMCTGQAAVNKWCKYVGWRDSTEVPLKKLSHWRRAGARQISLEARMRVAYDLARNKGIGDK